MVREFKERDLREIERIHALFHGDNFPMPNIAEAYANAVVELDGRVLGFGINRYITESIMILDLSLPLRIKSIVLSELIKESVRKSKQDLIHSFVESPTFEQVLKKHYGYKPCKGAALCLET